ncbi:MAG TPA: 4'-phosphopantetheinyl transferase superfamily protein [Ruminococcus sp.]|nr:4'-phosphopantetheinyl transferase superfamily protein [Ruminococcus sp.]
MTNRLYIMDVNILDNEELFRTNYEKMPERRKNKIDRFRFAKDKKLSLGAGMLLREALMCEGISEDMFAFNKNEKPFIPGRNDLFFNLSHSGTMAVCAVSDHSVGVDIETEQLFEDSFIQRIYLPHEAGYILAQGELRDKTATVMWTVKESIMKFFGTGLSLEPNKISLDMNGDISAVCQDFDASPLHFTQYSVPGYALTVCSEYEHFTNDLIWLNKDIK